MKNKIKLNMGRGLNNMNIEYIEIGDGQEGKTMDQHLTDFNSKFAKYIDQPLKSDGFPTIFKVFGKKLTYYTGNRDADSLYKWVTSDCNDGEMRGGYSYNDIVKQTSKMSREMGNKTGKIAKQLGNKTQKLSTQISDKVSSLVKQVRSNKTNKHAKYRKNRTWKLW